MALGRTHSCHVNVSGRRSVSLTGTSTDCGEEPSNVSPLPERPFTVHCAPVTSAALPLPEASLVAVPSISLK